MKHIVYKQDKEGHILIRGKCSCCKQCWVYLGGPMKGKCIYGGPYQGYEKIDNAPGSGDLGEAPAKGS